MGTNVTFNKDDSVNLGQESYIDPLLNTDCKRVDTPIEIIVIVN